MKKIKRGINGTHITLFSSISIKRIEVLQLCLSVLLRLARGLWEMVYIKAKVTEGLKTINTEFQKNAFLIQT